MPLVHRCVSLHVCTLSLGCTQHRIWNCYFVSDLLGRVLGLKKHRSRSQENPDAPLQAASLSDHAVCAKSTTEAGQNPANSRNAIDSWRRGSSQNLVKLSPRGRTPEAAGCGRWTESSRCGFCLEALAEANASDARGDRCGEQAALEEEGRGAAGSLNFQDRRQKSTAWPTVQLVGWRLRCSGPGTAGFHKETRCGGLFGCSEKPASQSTRVSISDAYNN